jgi:adenylate cyclase
VDAMTEPPQAPPGVVTSEQWRGYLTKGHPVATLLRRTFRLMPSSPRCATCFAPFSGVGGKVLGVTPFTQSRKAARFCKFCCENQPAGGAEVETGVLFADIRGYTAMSEQTTASEVARRTNLFYAIAGDVLVGHDALVDKLTGDEAMALFLPGFAGAGYIEKMLDAAEELLRAAQRSGEDWLSIGIGVDHGTAWVGNVGAEKVIDFTALGDVVNTAARLQAAAAPGQLLMSDRVHAACAGRYSDAERLSLELKGKSQPVRAWLVRVSA